MLLILTNTAGSTTIGCMAEYNITIFYTRLPNCKLPHATGNFGTYLLSLGAIDKKHKV